MLLVVTEMLRAELMQLLPTELTAGTWMLRRLMQLQYRLTDYDRTDANAAQGCCEQR
jgi:hypothetical protein